MAPKNVFGIFFKSSKKNSKGESSSNPNPNPSPRPRIRKHIDEMTHVDETSFSQPPTFYDVHVGEQLDHETLQRQFGNDIFFEDEENEEEELDETPTSPATQAPTQSQSQSGALPPVPPVRGKPKAERPKTSLVWKFFKHDKVNHRAICEKCKQVFAHTTSGETGGLSRHLKGSQIFMDTS